MGSGSGCSTIMEGSIVALSDSYEARHRRNPTSLPYALSGGRRGKVVRDDHSSMPFLVCGASGGC